MTWLVTRGPIRSLDLRQKKKSLQRVNELLCYRIILVSHRFRCRLPLMRRCCRFGSYRTRSTASVRTASRESSARSSTAATRDPVATTPPAPTSDRAPRGGTSPALAPQVGLCLCVCVVHEEPYNSLKNLLIGIGTNSGSTPSSF